MTLIGRFSWPTSVYESFADTYHDVLTLRKSGQYNGYLYYTYLLLISTYYQCELPVEKLLGATIVI